MFSENNDRKRLKGTSTLFVCRQKMTRLFHQAILEPMTLTEDSSQLGQEIKPIENYTADEYPWLT